MSILADSKAASKARKEFFVRGRRITCHLGDGYFSQWGKNSKMGIVGLDKGTLHSATETELMAANEKEIYSWLSKAYPAEYGPRSM